MISSFVNFFKELYAERNLIYRLAKNDFKARYSASVLGIIWAFVQPLITVLVFWYVFQMGFRNAPVNDIPYILWFVVAYVPWIYFNDMLTFGVNCLIDYSYLVKKMKFKVSILPVVKVLSSMFVHLFFLLFIFIIFGLYGFPITVFSVQALYYSLALTVFSIGFIWLVSALAVFFRDVSQIVVITLQIIFWATPIFWNVKEINSEVAAVLKLNPLYYIIEGYRESFIYKVPFWAHPKETLYFWVVTIIIFLLGTFVFKTLRPHFADEL